MDSVVIPSFPVSQFPTHFLVHSLDCIVVFRRIPGASEELCLVGHGAPLDVGSVSYVRPVSAPDQAVRSSEVAEQGEVAGPAWLAVYFPHKVAGEAEVVHADLLQLGNAAFVQLALSLSAAVGL